MKDLIHSMIVTTLKKVSAKYPSYDLGYPNVEFYRTSRTAGKAHYRSNTIRFNLDMAEEAGENFMDTVIHEIAHLVTRVIYPNAKQAHGPEFRNVCQWLGGSGKTYHNYTSAPPKRSYDITEYKVYCSCRHYWIPTRQWNKLQNGARLVCKHCRESVYSLRIECRTRPK